MGTALRGGIYARYSTDNQSHQSIETQVAECRSYCAANGIDVVGVFSDEAISGMTADRAGLDCLLQMVCSNELDIVVIYDQSRLSRDIVTWFTLRKTLPIYGVKLASVMRGEFGDLSDPTVFMVEGVEAVFNQLHVLMTRKKVTDSLRNKAQRCEWNGGTPCLGYDVVNGIYAINECEANIVRMLFCMYADGKGYTYIIDTLNGYGYRTKAGKTWGTNSLSTILRNERYVGVYTYGKTYKNPNGTRNSHKVAQTVVRIEGGVPQIIDMEVWTKVQKRLKDNRRNASYKAKVEYLLSGKIFCGNCGSAMCGERRRADYYYYMCGSRKRLKNCDMPSVRKEAIEQGTLSVVRNFLAQHSAEELADNIVQSMVKLQGAVAPVENTIKGELSAVSKKIGNITDAIADGMYSPSMRAKLVELEAQQAGLYKRLGDLNGTKQAVQKDRADIVKAMRMVKGNADNDKLLISLFVDRVICYHDGDFEVVLNGGGDGNSKGISIKGQGASCVVTEGVPSSAPIKHSHTPCGCGCVFT